MFNVCVTKGWNSVVPCSVFWQKASGGASVKVYLRKGRTLPSRERSVRNNPAATEVREEGGEEVLQAPEQRFPWSPWRGPHQSRHPHHSPWRTTRWSEWTCLEGAAACGEPALEQVQPKGPIHAGAWGGRSSREELLGSDHPRPPGAGRR